MAVMWSSAASVAAVNVATVLLVCVVPALLTPEKADMLRNQAHCGHDEIHILYPLQRVLIPAVECTVAQLYHILNLENELFASDSTVWYSVFSSL